MPHRLPARRFAPALLALTALTLPACHAHRPTVEPVEPTWSYHTGSDRLSNNAQWRSMIPESPLQDFAQAQVASVEDLDR